MKKVLTVCTVLLMITTASCNKVDANQEISNEISENSSLSQTSGNSSNDNTTGSSDDIIITMAVQTGVSPTVQKIINEFNEADNGYKIVFKDYMEYYDSGQETKNGTTPEAFAQIDNHLSLDIIKGGIVDVVPDYIFTDSGKYDSLIEKGAFANLYTFIDEDSEVNRTTLYEHILNLHEVNGKLYCLPTFFSIDTLAGQTRYVGEKENWNIDELIEHWNGMPDDATFNGYTTKDYVYMDLLRGNLSSFIDFENGTCNFNSPEFIKILDFCNSFSSPEYYKTDPAWNAPHFIMTFPIEGFEFFHDSLWNEQNESYTLVGYPSNDGCGAFIDTTGSKYAICAYSSPEIQKGAWQFIRMLASYEFQYDIGEYRFPINIKAFEAKGNEAVSKYGQSNLISIQGDEYDIGYLSQEEYDRLVTYIDNIQRINVNIENDILNIIEDEIWAMFDGEKTPELTAKNIQERAAILVSEKQ